MAPSQAQSADRFWLWFTANAQQLRPIEASRKEAHLDEVLEHLHAYAPKLFFEIGGAPDGPTELVITAPGDRELFHAVEALIARAPSLDGWRFIAFKPAHGFDFVTEYGATRLDPAKCWFMPLTSTRQPGQLGLRVACPDFDPDHRDDFENAVHVVLHTALGEMSAAQDIDHVEVGALPDDPEDDGYIELIELPAYITWRCSRGEMQ